MTNTWAVVVVAVPSVRIVVVFFIGVAARLVVGDGIKYGREAISLQHGVQIIDRDG